MLFKNSAQKIHVYAYDSTTGAAKTGDAAQITAYVSLDGSANAVDDTNPAEVDSTNMPGVYVFDLTAAETNCDSFALYAKSSTSNIRLEPIIGFTTAAAVPKVAAGSSGGLLISGSNTGTTTLAALTVTGALTVSDGVIITASTTDRAGFSATGNGTGAGFTATGGATGAGMLATGGGNNANADGFRITAGGALADGLEMTRFHVTGTTTLTGAASLGSTLTVTGATTFTGAVTGTNASNDLRGISVNMIKDQAITCSTGVTFNANVGTTQPVNFTGTGASAYVKTDVIDWGGTAIASAYVQANAAQWLGQTIHAATVNGVPVVQLHDSAGAGGINAPANFEDLNISDTTGLVRPDMANASGNYGGTVATVTTLTNLPAITSNWLTAAGIATDAGAEIADAVWDEALSGHAGAGSAGAALSTASTGGVDAGTLADAVWDELLNSGHSTANSAGKILYENLNAPVATVDTVVDGIATTLGSAGAGLTAVASATNLSDLHTDVGTVLTNLATVDGIVDSILLDTGTDGVVVASGSKTGYSLAAAGLDSVVIETGMNARQAMSVIASACVGILSGAATATVVIKAAQEGSTTRVTATVDADGNRSVVSLNLPT